MTHSNLERTIDSALVLRAAAAAAIATATTTTESTNVDLGTGYHRFDVYIDITTTVDEANDLVTIKVMGAHDAAFSVTNNLGTIQMGHQTALGTTNARGSGEYVLPCHNIGKGTDGVTDVTYRYIKIVTVTAGTTVSTDFTAWACKRT